MIFSQLVLLKYYYINWLPFWTPHSKGRDLFRRLEIEWLVHRYTGQDLPHCCIDETLAAWDKLRPDVGKELSKIKNYALPLVTQVLEDYLQISLTS